MKKIFIDTDIILDLFSKREPFYEFSAELFTLVDSGKVDAFITPIIVTNLHYILSKLKSKKQAIKNLQKLRTLVHILPVNEKIIDLALSSEFKDFEDAVQYYTALNNRLEYLITRNVNDYKSADITVLTAEEYLNLIRNK